MKIYIHAGLNKTGSSYLQEMFFANADALQREGIAYYGGERPGGNAAELSYAIRRNDISTASKLLQQHLTHAQEKKCERIFLSTEIFFHDFADATLFKQYRDLFAQFNLDDIHVLLFFREPVSHAISTYCHRSGLQDVGHFAEWIKTYYTYPSELRAFLALHEQHSDIHWTLRAYTRDALKTDSCQWLGIADLAEPPSDEINVSVTATETQLLAWLYDHNPQKARALRNRFKMIPRNKKASDRLLRSQWKHLAAVELKQHNNAFAALGKLVGADVGVKELSAPVADDASEQSHILLTPMQAKAVMEFCGTESPKVSFLEYLKSLRRKWLKFRRFGL